MSGSNRLDSILNKLNTVSSKSNEDLMNALINTGINLGEAYVTYNKQEQSSELESSLNDLSTTIKTLDWTQSGMDIEIGGETVDMYDFKRDATIKALENFKEVADTPYLKKKYSDANALVEESVTGILAYQDTMRNKRDQNVGELTSLSSELEALFIKDPLLNKDIDSRQGAIDIMESIKDTRAHTEAVFGKKILDQHTVPLTKLKQEYEILMSLYEADIDKSKEGLQVNLQDEMSPYLKEFLRGRGLEETELESGLIELTLPEGERVSTEDYADAIAAFKDYKTLKLRNSSASIIATKKLFASTDNAVVQEWLDEVAMTDQSKLGIISKAVLGTSQADMENANKYLAMIADPNERARLTFMIERIKREPELIESLGSHFEAILEEIQAEDVEKTTWKDIPFNALHELKGEALRAVNELNISMGGLDKKRKLGMNVFYEVEDLKDMTPSRVQAYQRNITERLNTLIAQDVGGPRYNPENEVVGKVKEYMNLFLDSIEQSDLTGQFSAIRKLRNEFIAPDGARLRPDDVKQMWDGDKDQMEVFYRLLEAFGTLDQINPNSTQIYWGQ